jgi:hypothetical protein
VAYIQGGLYLQWSERYSEYGGLIHGGLILRFTV